MNEVKISGDQLVKALEALGKLSPTQIQQLSGIAGVGARRPQAGYTFISESERFWHPPALIETAEAICKEWAKLGPDETRPAGPFSSKKWVRGAMEAARALKEANAETALAFLLRKGIQTLANDWYVVVPREWQDYCLVAPSDAVGEWYGPLYGSTVAGRIARGDRFPEGQIIGEDTLLVNYKFGLVESFERELFDDDQTGQIKQRAQRLGQSMAITENVYAALRFIGTAAQYSNLIVPRSNYTTIDVNGNPVNSPWSLTLNGAAGGNIPAAYAQLTLNLLKKGWSDLLNMKDPLQNKIIVQPNILLHSSMDALHAPLLVTPPSGVPYYPAVIGASGQTSSSATAGFPGGVFGANPFMGLGIKPVLARFLPDWSWALGEKGKGIVFQERDPLEVMQENPQAGAAFEVDAFRFRSRRRFEVDWVGGGSRFWWLGNDGSATGSF